MTLYEAMQARDEAIESVDAHADDEWKARALEAVRQVALRSDFFSTDDVWAHGLDLPRQARAIGAIMQRAVKEGFIEWSGTFAPSSRSHCSPVRRWKSLLKESPRKARTT